MTKKQKEHVESQLIKFIDKAVEKQNATTSEMKVLAEVAFALAEIHKLI